MFGFSPFASKPFGDAEVVSFSQLFHRNTQTNGITSGGVACYDLLTTAGASVDTAVVTATASGTDIQFTKTAGGAVLVFASGRVPAAGWTITAANLAVWALQNVDTVNAGLRVRFYKWSSGTETLIGGGPFDDGVELTTAAALYEWLADVTDTALVEDERLLVKYYLTNVGTMGAGTATLRFNGALGGTAPTFRSSSTVTAVSGSLSFPQPTGATTGDFVLFSWTCYAPGTVTYPSTMVGTTQNNQSGPDGEDTGFAGRFLDGTESWPFVVTFSGGADRTGIAVAFQNVNTDTPFDVTPTYTESQASKTTPISTSCTGITPSAKSCLVWLANTDQTIAADRWSYSTPSGFTMREDVHSINWAHLALATQENWSGGATGSITATATRDSGTGNAGWAGYVIALRASQDDSYINVYPNVTFKAEGGGGAYTLTCNAGSYSLSGQSATLLKTKLITANAGAYTYSGVSAGLARNRVLTAQAGSYAFAGQSAGLLKTKLITASAGSYTYTGVNAGLLKTKLLNANAGAYSFAGQDAVLTKTTAGAYTLTCLAGSYTLNGQSATLTYSGSASTIPAGGGKSKGGKKRTIIIEVDGKDYRMDEGYVSTFLANLEQKVVEQPVSRKKAKFVRKAPVIVVKSAPVEYIARAQQEVDRTSEKIDALFNIALIRYAQELDDEDAILMLIG